MFEEFEAYITSHAGFTKDELRQMRLVSTVKKLRRRQYLLQEGEICRYKTFVVKGLLKTYRLKDDGTEYIMRFAAENAWSVDHESYHKQTPSRYFIEALENVTLIQWRKEDFDVLLENIPALKTFSEKIKSDNLDASQNRILMNISYTSEEKYQQFITAYPDIFRRVPLHMVASYLGVSRETLSRIRHAQSRPQD
ncbi:Crp/Fnr family transcriptional regulator [uncultured Chitinophaga sp.]|jgi:cAMP-binding proteins - catabolite gene activator and regulatory subunit of cAMP-dependent protein kinases|uniref:Crp/Fnr family transcriptional regulator n=1 Tax=uncultured Chitinophaga sp. TaxID=339340 RepID=UPI00260A73B8|nr:Crp/Fnr family transcriptional regulator [uncultured Chitinophaga sp.]